MSLATIGTGLAVAQAGIGIANGVAQWNNAKEAKDHTTDAAQKQTMATYAEVQRQAGEVNRIAAEQTSDRVRAANEELSTAKVAAMERGVSGTTMSSIVREIAYLEGADISRIESNRKSNIEAGEAAKASAKNGFLETINIAQNQLNVATTGAILGTVGSGLSIAGNYYANQQQLASLQNTR